MNKNQKLGIIPITSELVSNDEDLFRRFDIKPEETKLAYHMMYDDNAFFPGSNYIELIKYEVPEHLKDNYIKRLKNLPYVSGVVSDYVPGAIHCYVKCEDLHYANVADVWKQIDNATRINFSTQYPDRITYNRIEDAEIHYRNLEDDVESFWYMDVEELILN